MILFVTGIDTGIGKTVATGRIARWYAGQGFSVATQKLVQTGCEGLSEDILTHRRIMGVDLLPEDRCGLTCPCVFRFPGSPHLAAALEGRRIDLAKLEESAQTLSAAFEVLLVEGAGGLCVPLTEEVTVLDFVVRQGWPVILVTAPRLGSINHTLLSLEALRARRVAVAGVIYNLHPAALPEIVEDSRRVIRRAMARAGMAAPLIDMSSQAPGPSGQDAFSGLPLPGPAPERD